jgi:hypothetical protein
MPKSKLGFIVSISVGVILMIAAVIVIINDAAQNLYNSNVIIGRVVDKDISELNDTSTQKITFFLNWLIQIKTLPFSVLMKDIRI